MPGAKILVVDDEQSILDLVSAYLRREGYEVYTAPDGPSGLQAARAFKPDLVVLDVMLPGMDGIEVLARLRRESPLVGRDFNVLYFPWNSAAIAYQELLDRAPVVISCRGSQINVAPHNPERADLRDGLAATFARAAAVHAVERSLRRPVGLAPAHRRRDESHRRSDAHVARPDRTRTPAGGRSGAGRRT